MAKWNEYGLKTGTSARDEVLILDSDTNTNKRITVGDIQEFSNGKMLEKENSTLSTEAKTLIGAINEVDAKNNAQDESLEAIEKKFSSYVKKTDVDSTLLVAGSPADAKVVGERFKSSEKAVAELADKKITKFYASSQGNTHLPDSDKGKIQDMFLYGKSEQAQYKGKNLLNPQAQTQTKSGITLTANGDGTYTVKGTATEDTLFPVNSIGVEANKTYRLVGCPSGGSNATYNMVMQDTVNWSTAFDNGSGVNKSYSESYTIRVSIQIKSGVTVNNLIFKPMLTTDISVTYADFEPYVGGIPSPNPEYPQEIKSVVNPKVVVCGKNIAKKVIVLDIFKQYDIPLYIVADLRPSTTYVLSFECASGYSGYVNELLFEQINFVGTGNRQSVICKTKSVLQSSQLSVNGWMIVKNNTGNTIVPKFTNVMLERISSSITYEPYTEQSVTLPYTLNAIPVKTGGNVTIDGQQYVADYVDVERGKLVRMCKEIDFTKVSPVLYSNPLVISREVRYSYKEKKIGVKPLDDKATYGTGAGYITNARFIGMGTWNNDVIGIAAHGQGDGNYISIRIPLDVDAIEYFTSIGGCKGIFQIATPEEIDLTPEQIQAYKSLSTNYPVTNIEVSSEQLDGYTIFNYPISMAEGWNYVKQQLNDNRDYIYDMDLQSAEAYVNSEYAVALTELEVM